jgi:hypothetical protein
LILQIYNVQLHAQFLHICLKMSLLKCVRNVITVAKHVVHILQISVQVVMLKDIMLLTQLILHVHAKFNMLMLVLLNAKNALL